MSLCQTATGSNKCWGLPKSHLCTARWVWGWSLVCEACQSSVAESWWWGWVSPGARCPCGPSAGEQPQLSRRTSLGDGTWPRSHQPPAVECSRCFEQALQQIQVFEGVDLGGFSAFILIPFSVIPWSVLFYRAFIKIVVCFCLWVWFFASFLCKRFFQIWLWCLLLLVYVTLLIKLILLNSRLISVHGNN